MNKIIISGLFLAILVPIFIQSAQSTQETQFEEFENWAKIHGIELVGVSKNSYDLYYLGYDENSDYVNWREIPNVLIAAYALYKIPDNVISVMDGKTIYFSTEYGRSYSVLGSFPEYEILMGLNKGIILEQNINEHTVIHEIGHIVDYHGIKGMYGDEQNIFSDSLKDRNEIFSIAEDISYDDNIPIGYVSAYATVNDAENFAENFAYYILYQNEFEDRISSDHSLISEYEFMRDVIFIKYELNN